MKRRTLKMKEENNRDEGLTVLEDVIKMAKSSGADAADAVLIDSLSLSVSRRLGKQETLERSESGDVGIRVLVGKKQAIVSSTDRSPEALKDVIDQAVAMARAVPEDAYCGIADPNQVSKNWQDLDLYDDKEISAEEMNEIADKTEDAARSVKGITNSEGAEFGQSKNTICYAASNGFAGSYKSSGFSLSACVLAGEGLEMERDYEYDASCYFEDLKSGEEIGLVAGERTVKRLNPQKGETKSLPVVFDKRLSGGLIGSLASAASGSSVARGTSFIKDKMEKQIFHEAITIIEDPFIKRGHRSKAFDGEGISPQKREIVKDGILQGWFLDLASARQLGLQSTGNAARGTTSLPRPSVTNLYMQPGEKSSEDLIAEIDEGFLVTDLMGMGVNLVTGDYSQGAAGFWIEKGEIAYPVSEMTIASNLNHMWMNIAAANDLELRRGVDAPSLRVDGMMIAGA